MKRIICVLVLMMMCVVLLTGCGSNNDTIKEELRGSWGYDFYASAVKQHCHQVFTFAGDGKVKADWINDEAPSKSSHGTGTYVIKDKKIEIQIDGETKVRTIEYSYNNGNLKLFYKGTDGSIEQELYKR